MKTKLFQTKSRLSNLTEQIQNVQGFQTVMNGELTGKNMYFLNVYTEIITRKFMASMRYKNNKRLVLIIDVGNDIIYLYEYKKNKGGGFKVKKNEFCCKFCLYIF